jgi:hypothetical protein
MGPFQIFHKLAEIFANEYLSPLSTTLVTSCSLASMTPAINLLPVSLTPAINSFHRFSVFDSVVDNGDKFIAGDNNTSDKFTAGDKNKDAMGVGNFQG